MAATTSAQPIPERLRIGPMIQAVDAHAAGEPGRVIVGGVDAIPGTTMFDAMTWLQANQDDLRLASPAATRPRTATWSCRPPTRRPTPVT